VNFKAKFSVCDINIRYSDFNVNTSCYAS
jgi:hypothetical protein